MSTEEKKRNFFLCCICGIKIHSNRFNLGLHEKLHGSHVTKIKCAAKHCDSTLVNKSVYWRHWVDHHSELTMPDFIIYVDVPTGRGRRTRSAGRGRRTRSAGLAKEMKKVSKGGAIHATQMMMSKQATKCDVSKNDCTRRIDNNEKPNDVFTLNIENTIEDCLLRDPYYGCLNDSSV